jgi:single-stranded-DNA-specific exonuclease
VPADHAPSPAPDPARQPEAAVASPAGGIIALPDALAAARLTTSGWLGARARGDRVVVFCHFDADGLAAGALFGRALPRLGFTDVQVVASGRGESAFSDGARARLARLAPDALVVTDLGVQADGVLPDVPTLYVDHHRPEGTPAGATVVSGYGWDPIPNSAWLAFELLAPLVDVNDLGWIAAVGTISDLGDRAPWDALPALRKRYTAKWLKEAVALVNAARRASAFDVGTPLALLMTADHPRAVSEDEGGGAGLLRGYRAEVQAALAEARRRAPIFATGSPFALVPLDSTCQVHPLVAQQWRGRLPHHAVIAANRGYLPGVVAFSTRTARADLSLPALFRAVDLGAANASFGHGHDQASGGHLAPADFNRLTAALGFDERARVPEGGGAGGAERRSAGRRGRRRSPGGGGWARRRRARGA